MMCLDHLYAKLMPLMNEYLSVVLDLSDVLDSRDENSYKEGVSQTKRWLPILAAGRHWHHNKILFYIFSKDLGRRGGKSAL